MIEIEITKDTATPMVEALQDAVDNPEQMMAVAGKRLANELRDHFRAKDAEGNKRNWPEQHFWNRIRNATALASVSDGEAVVTVSDPALSQKIYGGTITPKRCANLALPASAAAYAAGSPREGGGPPLTFAFAWDVDRAVWRPALVAKYNYQRKIQKGKRAGKVIKANAVRATEGIGTVWYWLVKSVTQAPDLSALPDTQDLEDAIHDEWSMLLARITADAEREAA